MQIIFSQNKFVYLHKQVCSKNKQIVEMFICLITLFNPFHINNKSINKL